MSVGKPIIAFSSPNSELRLKVESNKIGYWIELGDTDGLVACIRRLIKNPEEIKATGARAREVLVDQYSIDVSGKKYFDVLTKGYGPPRQ